MRILKFWLGAMYVHTPDAGSGKHGGWIPREMILGDESTDRVPTEFRTQRVDVANPPTLLLVVRSLLERMTKSSLRQQQEQEDVADTADSNSSSSSDSTDPPVEELRAYLHSIHKPLDLWVRWLFRTQQGSVPGSFRWRGRHVQENKLMPNTLASGLDDFPRSAIPSEEERHVDILSWVAMAAKVMSQLEEALHLPAGQRGLVDVGQDYPPSVPTAAAAASKSDAAAAADPDTSAPSNKYSYAELAPYLQSRLTALHWHTSPTHPSATATITPAAADPATHGGRFADVGIAGSGVSSDRILRALAVLCAKSEESRPAAAAGNGHSKMAFVPIEEIQRQQDLHEQKVAVAKAAAAAEAEAKALAEAQRRAASSVDELDAAAADDGNNDEAGDPAASNQPEDSGKDADDGTFQMDFTGVCPASHPYFKGPLSDGRGGYSISERYILSGESVLKPLQHTGYVNLFPFLLRLIPADNQSDAATQQQHQQQLDYSLRLMEDPMLLWTPHGLRSIARSDVFYRKGWWIWYLSLHMQCRIQELYRPSATACPYGNLNSNLSCSPIFAHFQLSHSPPLFSENAPGDAPYWRGPRMHLIGEVPSGSQSTTSH